MTSLDVPHLGFDIPIVQYDGEADTNYVENQTDFLMSYASAQPLETDGGGFLSYSSPLIIIGSIFVLTYAQRKFARKN